MFEDLLCGEASEASCDFSVDTGTGGLNLMPMTPPRKRVHYSPLNGGRN